jgi:hypothetical protein
MGRGEALEAGRDRCRRRAKLVAEVANRRGESAANEVPVC